MTRSPETNARDALVGVILDGRFRIEALVGEGGFGVVYRATQLNVGREVAVKVLRPEVSASARHAERFVTEARIIAQLRHPNTLKLLDFGRASEGRLYFVTEFLHGATLDARIAAGDLGQTDVVRILVQMCDALAEAHERGVIHCDLKPRNIFVERVGGQWIAKVLDFGIARLRETAQPLDAPAWSSARDGASGQSRLAGTPAYMSPEQLRGGVVDARSDLYALGVVAYECLAGAPPFSDPETLAMDHLTSPPLPFGERPGAAPVEPALEALVLQLLAKHPDDRPSTAQAVRARLVALESDAARDDQRGRRVAVGADAAAARPTATASLELVEPQATSARPAPSKWRRAVLGVAAVAAGWALVASQGAPSHGEAPPSAASAPTSPTAPTAPTAPTSVAQPAAPPMVPVSSAVAGTTALDTGAVAARPPRPRPVAVSTAPVPPQTPTEPASARSPRRLPGFFQVKTTP